MSHQPSCRECGGCAASGLCPASNYHRVHDPGIMHGITATTPCLERFGGVIHHYPFTRSGTPVTMPGPDVPGFGGVARPVMLGICMSVHKPVYLVAPRELNPATPPRMCAECLYEHFQDLRRLKEQGQLAGVG